MLSQYTLAAASYNGGMNGISKKMEEQQVDNYYDLLLTEETSRYVFRILALKEIMKNSDKYGFSIPKEALYYTIPTKKIVIDSSITDLAKFAKTQGKVSVSLIAGFPHFGQEQCFQVA